MSLPEFITSDPPTHPSHTLYTQVESYPWSSDQDFQTGLAAILGPSPSTSPQSQLEDLTLRARCFYFTRKYNTLLDFVEYKIWRAAQPAANLSSLVPSAPIESPISATSTQSPLWPQATMVVSPLNPSTSDYESVVINGEATLETTQGDRGHEETQQETYITQRATQPLPPAQPSYPSSFEEIMHLIQTGQPIPGIKEIPDTVLSGQGTEATRNRRRKPWEKDEASHASSETYAI